MNETKRDLVISEFNRLKPVLEMVAEAIARRPLPIKLTPNGEGTSSTNGKFVYLPAPAALANVTTHDRMLCDRRDVNRQQRCAECGRRERLLGMLCHEVAHVIHGTLDRPAAMPTGWTMPECPWLPTERRAVFETELRGERAMSKYEGWLEFASMMGQYLSIFLNGMEDIRIEAAASSARPGMADIFTAMKFRSANVTEAEYVSWTEREINFQVIVAIIFDAGGQDIAPYFDPKVVADVRSPAITALWQQVTKKRNPQEVFAVSLKLYGELCKLGYFEGVYEEPQPEPEPEPSEPEDQPDREESDDDVPGDQQEEGQGDPSDPDQADVPESGSDDAGAEGEPGDPGEDGQSGGAGDEDPEPGSDTEAGPEGGAGDQDSGSGADDGDGSDSGSEVFPSRGDSVPDTADSGGPDSGGSDQDSMEPADSGSDQGSPGSDAPEGDGESSDGEGEPEAGAPEGTGDAEGEASGGDADAGQGGSSSGAGDEGSAGGEFGESSSGTASHDDSSPADDGDSDGRSDLDEESADPASEDGPESDGGVQRGDTLGSDDDDSGTDGGDESGRSLDDVPEFGVGDEGGSEEGSASPSTHAAFDLEPDEPDGEGGVPEPSDVAPGNFESDGGDDEVDRESDTLDGESYSGQSGDAQGNDPAGRGIESPSKLDRVDADGISDAEPLSEGGGGWGGPVMGTPDEVSGMLDDLLGHDHGKFDRDHSGDDVAEEFDPRDLSEISAAAYKPTEFAKPSKYVNEVVTFNFDGASWRVGKGGLPSGYARHRFQDMTSEKFRLTQQIEKEYSPSEATLGKALLQLRIILEANARGGTTNNLKSGKIRPAVLGRRAGVGDPRLFRSKSKPEKRNYYVLLRLDVSGSTGFGGGMILSEQKKAVWAQAELLHRLGVPFEIIADTGAGDTEDSLKLAVFFVKSLKDGWDSRTKSALLSLRPLSGNLDGHAVEVCLGMAVRATATDKIVMYYSDGAMPSANYDEELEILQRCIVSAKRMKITLMCVGIHSDAPMEHGLDTVVVNSEADIPNVVRHLGKRIGA